jgi:hypothetical protein
MSFGRSFNPATNSVDTMWRHYHWGTTQAEGEDFGRSSPEAEANDEYHSNGKGVVRIIGLASSMTPVKDSVPSSSGYGQSKPCTGLERPSFFEGGATDYA